MRFLALVLIPIILLQASCGEKNDSDTAVSTTKDNEFTKQFNVIALPLTIADTTLDKAISKEKILKISGKKYFPDSLILRYFEKGEKVNFYPIGKVQNEDQEIYIILKGISGNKKAAFILCYDNQLQYKDGALICKTDIDAKTSYRCILTKNFDIKILKATFVANGEPELSESYLAYNNAGFLGEVVTNVSDEEMDLTNPIDTLPQTRKFTGDYFFDKKNFVSLRNAKDSSELTFFYHFEKEKQDCSGELKDKIKLTGTNTAAYIKDGDPCVINFIFSGNQLLLKEDHGCGNKRPLDCTLDGTFTKRAAKAVPKKTDKNTTVPKPGAPSKSNNANKPQTINGIKPIPVPATKTTPAKPVPVKKVPVKQPEIH